MTTVTKEEFRRRVMAGLRERRTRAIRYQTLRQKQGRKPW